MCFICMDLLLLLLAYWSFDSGFGFGFGWYWCCCCCCLDFCFSYCAFFYRLKSTLYKFGLLTASDNVYTICVLFTDNIDIEWHFAEIIGLDIKKSENVHVNSIAKAPAQLQFRIVALFNLFINFTPEKYFTYTAWTFEHITIEIACNLILILIGTMAKLHTLTHSLANMHANRCRARYILAHIDGNHASQRENLIDRQLS